MSREEKPHVVDHNSQPNSLVQRLAMLKGTWDVEITMTADQAKVAGKSTVRWLPGEYFLEVRATMARDDFPRTHMIIGGDDQAGQFTALYFDSRGVARTYQMSLDEHSWKMWTETTGFSQRFIGDFRDNGRVIEGRWEAAHDRVNWEVDFHLTYTKVR